MRIANLLHASLAAITLLACIFLPRPGSAVLLVPVWPGAISGAWHEPHPGMKLIGQGRIAGTIVVLPQGGLSIDQLLKSGLIPISAPDFLCGNARQPA